MDNFRDLSATPQPNPPDYCIYVPIEIDISGDPSFRKMHYFSPTCQIFHCSCVAEQEPQFALIFFLARDLPLVRPRIVLSHHEDSLSRQSDKSLLRVRQLGFERTLVSGSTHEAGLLETDRRVG